jgi:hypothetical protein
MKSKSSRLKRGTETNSRSLSPDLRPLLAERSLRDPNSILRRFNADLENTWIIQNWCTMACVPAQPETKISLNEEEIDHET